MERKGSIADRGSGIGDRESRMVIGLKRGNIENIGLSLWFPRFFSFKFGVSVDKIVIQFTFDGFY
eukprot:scaffold1778_cov246-Pinguiococcus_pyrenoidosus.AAC.20